MNFEWLWRLAFDQLDQLIIICFTTLGVLWIAVRQLMGKVGARKLEAAMKGAEGEHNEGIRKNLELAERHGWHQVIRHHRKLDPNSRFSKVVGLVAVVLCGGLVGGVAWGNMARAFPEIDRMGSLGVVLIVLPVAVIVSGGLLVWARKGLGW